MKHMNKQVDSAFDHMDEDDVRGLILIQKAHGALNKQYLLAKLERDCADLLAEFDWMRTWKGTK